MQGSILQIELNHYILGHGFETMPQDNGVAFLTPVVLRDGQQAAQWEYVETYRQARQALGY